MKKALILQHMDHDHAGRFLDWFAEDGLLPVPVRLFAGEAIPPLKDYDLMLVLGGAQDTWQEDEYPYLRDEKATIREWVNDRAKPYLGICLGHQMLAEALGGDVGLAEGGEVGVHTVTLTDEGRQHPAMGGVPHTMQVMQWHNAEVQTLPAGARVLARSPATAVQAMAIGNHALSTQFHCEFTAQTVAGWTSLPNYVAALERELGPGAYARLARACLPLMPEMHRHTRMIWENFKRLSGLSP